MPVVPNLIPSARPWYGVVRRDYDGGVLTPENQAVDISVRQFVADSGSVTRGLRQGRSYTLTLNGQPLARIVPVRQRLAVPRDEVLTQFAAAPVIDPAELRADVDEAVSQGIRDPFAGPVDDGA